MLQKLFGFDARVHSVKAEVIGGVTTFFTMAYILAVNPNIFADLGNILGADRGMPDGASFTATALAALVGTLLMAFYAKKPFGLAPGMGLNAFFVYTVCVGMGYTWQFALTAILLEGIIFVVLSATHLREAIVNAFPRSMQCAIGAGIGLYIAFIGLQNAGIVVSNASTSVSLGSFSNPNVQLAVIGLFITGVLMVRKVTGGLLLGIIITTLIGIPMGVTKYGGIASVPPSIAPIFCQFELQHLFSWDMLIVVFTFLFLDIFDTMGTVVGVALKAGMVDEQGKVKGVSRVFMADALATMAGACFGTNTATTYMESATGIASGGRTGLTAFVIAICFALSLFFAPLFLAIPSAATGPVLVLVGVMMCTSIAQIDWEDLAVAIPSFVTMLLMPLAYSISDGIMLGVITYVVLNMLCGRARRVNVLLYVLAALFVVRYILIA